MPEKNIVPEKLNQLVREEVQPREIKYGRGENQRVWEVDYHGVKIGFNLGDIAAAPTEAIMCPTTPWLEVGGGAIENRIASFAGNELFGKYTQEIIRLMTQIRSNNDSVSIQTAKQLSRFLSDNTGMKIDKSPEEFRSEVLQATSIDKLGGDIGEHVALFYGGSIPAPAGKELGKNGIRVVVLTNVTPKGKMTEEDMVRFTEGALQAASLTGVDSITIPAVGTGFAAAFGFGMSQRESIGGFFRGVTEYIDNSMGKTSLKRIDYNIYAKPSLENARQIGKLLMETDLGKKLLS